MEQACAAILLVLMLFWLCARILDSIDDDSRAKKWQLLKESSRKTITLADQANLNDDQNDRDNRLYSGTDFSDYDDVLYLEWRERSDINHDGVGFLSDADLA